LASTEVGVCLPQLTYDGSTVGNSRFYWKDIWNWGGGNQSMHTEVTLPAGGVYRIEARENPSCETASIGIVVTSNNVGLLISDRDIVGSYLDGNTEVFNKETSRFGEGCGRNLSAIPGVNPLNSAYRSGSFISGRISRLTKQ
jgi:hypothetical protein